MEMTSSSLGSSRRRVTRPTSCTRMPVSLALCTGGTPPGGLLLCTVARAATLGSSGRLDELPERLWGQALCVHGSAAGG